MLPLRQELKDLSRSCERLISAAGLQNATAFSSVEIDCIAYYVRELTSLVNRLAPDRHPQEAQKRQTMKEYASASEAVMHLKDLSEDERQSVLNSVADVQTNILDDSQR
ncbi:hypothetical protein YTPLAS18_01410 [Nitrospira sp.]|nr:hypothetical protein YTPLAS18_01410 [Nitrospira sp.]